MSKYARLPSEDETLRLTLLRHQVGALAATAVDFFTMVLAVERFGVRPAVATAIGAMLGACVNFVLGRAWIFRHNTGPWQGQVLRYGLVSVGSAGWNAVGEYAAHDGAHVPYVSARVLIAIAVGLLWNFPMQRRFVFRERQTRLHPT